MKITFIRHSKVDYRWQKSYTAESFNLACQHYDSSSVNSNEKLEYHEQRVYISNLSRTRDTVKLVLSGEREIIQTALLNEVPMVSFTRIRFPLPTIVWMIAGRLQWYFNSSRQTESRKQSIERINKFLDLLQEESKDCIIVGHGFYFAQLVNEMKKRGITGDMRKKLKNDEARVLHLPDQIVVSTTPLN